MGAPTFSNASEGKGRADSPPKQKFLAPKRKRRRRRSPPNSKTHIMSGSCSSSVRRSLGVITRSMRRRLEEGVSQKLGRKNGVNSCRKRAG